MTDQAIQNASRPNIGLMGGTFDPIHLAHVRCAQAASDALHLDKVIFIPASLPSFKLDRKLADFGHRMKMCELAISGIEGFEASDIERRRDGVSYTIDTVKELLTSEYANSNLYFIIGSDAFLTLPKWKDAEELAELVSFAVLMRAEDDASEVFEVGDGMDADVHIIDHVKMDVSSSDIRRLLSEGISVGKFLPDSVFKYIEEEGLYDVKEA